MAFLKVFAAGEERTVFLGDAQVTLGRDQTCDILLTDIKASRMHCVIEPYHGGWRVRDLDSGNGTKVNGKRIGHHILAPEDVIKVGDAKIVYAGEGVTVVGQDDDRDDEELVEQEPERRLERGRRGRESDSSVKVGLVVGALLLVGFGVLAVLWRGGDRKGADPEDLSAYRAVMDERADAEIVRLGQTFLHQYPESSRAADVRLAVDRARQRLRDGTAGRQDGYDPAAELQGLRTAEAVERLETMLTEVEPARRPAVQGALMDMRKRLYEEREGFFGQLEKVFTEHVARGEFARARELWFFLAGDQDWDPVPDPYPDRIVEANRELENAASAARSKLFVQSARAEEAHDFDAAIKSIETALPRFKGTAVARSLRERLAFYREARRVGVQGKPTRPRTVVRLDVEKKLNALLARLEERAFAEAAAGLRALAGEVKKRKERGYAEVMARARECEAAAALHAGLVERLEGGKPPSKQLRRKWRVLSGGKEGCVVRSKGEEQRYAWGETPAELYLALLELHAGKVKHGHIGLVVAAHAVGGPPAAIEALALAYEQERKQSLLDAFVAARLLKEPPAEGGYVVHAGKILTRKEHLRRQEEELIKNLQAQLTQAHEAILEDGGFKKLDKLRTRKDALDSARARALELIFDEKKYFYPYRGTGRMGEYTKVQQEVDRRVAAVRELWEDRMSVTVKATPELQKSLERFDAAASELEKRLVDVQDKIDEVAFLRSCLGTKFNVRNFFRTPEEWDLLRYSDEVVEFNPTVEGDITKAEREQVRITNAYRIMFGRWPLRLIEKLVLSSRGHCQEMSKLGYFGHFSPTPGRRTPYDRMKLQGYTYGSSENCIMGRTGPQAAHDGWCHSSGHHRNILMPPWTEMGTGHSGRYMTQNYGQAPKYSKNDPVEEEEPLREWELEQWDDEENGDEESEKDEGEFDYGDEEE